MNKNELLKIIKEAAKNNETNLYLGFNKLTELSPEIGKLSDLTWLYLGFNKLTELPPEIGKLYNLTFLDLGGNKLEKLPPEIWKLSNLTKLYLCDNKFTELPPKIWELSNLKFIDGIMIETILPGTEIRYAGQGGDTQYNLISYIGRSKQRFIKIGCKTMSYDRWKNMTDDHAIQMGAASQDIPAYRRLIEEING